MTTFAPPGVLIQTPQLPSHHIAKLPSGTTSSSISSLSHVPHSGKVDKIQDSLVISFTFGIAYPPQDILFYILSITPFNRLKKTK